MENQKIRRLHATIHGRVQGVGFRAFTASSASRLGLEGWVRNRYNGTVETVAEGDQDQLQAFLRELHRGPGPANVTRVDTDWLDATGEFNSFRIKMTG